MQKSITLQEITNSKVLVRVSFDLPNLKDTTRILDAIPTIKQLLEQNNKLIICTKWGKVNKNDKILESEMSKNELSTSKLIEVINSEFTKINLSQTKNSLKNSLNAIYLNQFENNFETQKIDESFEKTSIILLENTHFDPQEKSKDTSKRLEIAKKYSGLADFYVNEAFPSSHRLEATNTEIREFLPNTFGLSYLAEVENLNKLKQEIKRPYMVVMAGSKLETKLPLIQQMLPKADKILLGGMLAFTFIKVAKDLNLPLMEGFDEISHNYPELFDSQIETDFLETAQKLLQTYPQKLVLPVDFVYGEKEGKKYAFDVGPKTLELYKKILKESKTIFWNGTLGYYEQKPFDFATLELANFVASLNTCFTTIGGGDTNSSLPTEILKKFSFVSMGGGATLEYLSK